MRIYLAAPLFTSAERHWNKMLAQEIEALHDVSVWLPQEHEPEQKTSRGIFWEDVDGINCSDVVVAIMDGSDPDSGTSWECGYAFAKNKPIFLIRTDFRGGGEDRDVPYNIMLAECTSPHLRAQMPLASAYQVAAQVVKFIKEEIRK